MLTKINSLIQKYKHKYDKIKEPYRLLLFLLLMSPILCMLATDSVHLNTLGLELMIFIGIIRAYYLYVLN
jgi:hypothetical protein